MIGTTVLMLASTEGERASANNAAALAAFVPLVLWILVAGFLVVRRRRRRPVDDHGHETADDQ